MYKLLQEVRNRRRNQNLDQLAARGCCSPALQLDFSISCLKFQLQTEDMQQFMTAELVDIPTSLQACPSPLQIPQNAEYFRMVSQIYVPSLRLVSGSVVSSKSKTRGRCNHLLSSRGKLTVRLKFDVRFPAKLAKITPTMKHSPKVRHLGWLRDLEKSAKLGIKREKNGGKEACKKYTIKLKNGILNE
ncbi:hypothetical protein AVEN_254681-1 [Araneus ventricosus]|uniref:Uncharacterized protein n=1 Tax=Araneus ventricosus TaxID=182803 RepID=A0A4Y2R7U1_ARAVE|nr:hypothetical protein AVEN_254681-1 [Araneus ventricosus]